MRITWAIEDNGSGQATTQTVDEAADALVTAVRDACRDLDTQTTAHVLLTRVAPLRVQLVTAGRYEVEHGRTWEAALGGIMVQLIP